MKQILIFGFLALAAACSGRHPPGELTIDNRFSLEQRTVIDDVLDQYCIANGWCPKIVEKAENGIYADWNFARHERTPGVLASNVEATNIFVDMNGEFVNDMRVFWATIAHELAHYALEEHLIGGVLRCTYNHELDQDDEMCIDQLLLDKWCDAQSCAKEPQSTCVSEPEPKQFCIDEGF